MNIKKITKKFCTALLVTGFCFVSVNTALASDLKNEIDLNEYELVEMQPFSTDSDVTATMFDENGNATLLDVDQQLYKSRVVTLDEEGNNIEKYALVVSTRGTYDSTSGSKIDGSYTVEAHGTIYYEVLNAISHRITNVNGYWELLDRTFVVKNASYAWQSGPYAQRGGGSASNNSFDEDVNVFAKSGQLKLTTSADYRHASSGTGGGSIELKVTKF